jgi:peptide/nickel transport system permease protein
MSEPIRGLFPRLRLPLPSAWSSVQLWLGLTLGLAIAAVAVLHPLLTPYDPLQGALLQRLKPPATSGHWLGTDQLGRDLWTRTVYGFPWSLGIATTATLISTSIGIVVGLAAARATGRLRNALILVIDTVIAFPILVLAVTVIALLGRGFWPLTLTLGLSTWPVIARVVYAESRGLLQRDYVLAARLYGVGSGRILWAHVLPGLRPTILVVAAFAFADKLIAESALSFLGLGAPLDAPTWGNMLSESRLYMVNAPWMMLVPATAIVVAVITLNLIGDGIAAVSRRRARAVEG